MRYPHGWAALSRVHPTYRCGICRSLLVMGEPHSHRRTNRVVASILGPTRFLVPKYGIGSGYMR